MEIIGIIAEYNPFHNGHLYQINKIKEKYPDSILIAVVSSVFTQRGDISIINKWDKTKIALDNKIDLVIELPFVYATQSSDIFAKGAIEILSKLKVDRIVFGTECEDINILEKAASIQIENKEYDMLVKKYLSEGSNYATSMNKAIEELIDIKIDSPNDLLALSYIKQIKLNKLNIKYENIKRTVSYHNNEIDNNIASASTIRKMYLEERDIRNLIPFDKKCLYKISIANYFNMLKYKILTEDINIGKYQTVDEKIENRIIKVVKNANSYEELIQGIKSKRTTYNKVSRMLLHILTSFTKEEASKIKIDYIRVLGFNINGRKYLNKIKKDIDVNLLTGYKKNISKVLDIEYRITKIYSLITNNNLIDKEYQIKPIIKENND